MSTLPAAGTWRDLVLPLRSLLGEEWPALRDSVAVNETIAFARRLEDLGHHGGCQLLLSYAETLSGHAKVYAVDALENISDNSPHWLRRSRALPSMRHDCNRIATIFDAACSCARG
jgi:hypothetical protein